MALVSAQMFHSVRTVGNRAIQLSGVDCMQSGILYAIVIRQEYGQTSGRVKVRTEDRHRTVVILLVYNGGRAHDLEVM